MLIRGLKSYLSSENPYHWVFNSQVTDQGKPLQFTQRGVQWCIKEAKSKLGIKKKVTAHVFRHTYATHLLEDGLDIISVKELLGHARIETTLVYLHVANLEKKNKFSPLETLYSSQVEG